MQPNDDDSIPDSPFPQEYETPRTLTPRQRTDSYLPEEFPTFPVPPVVQTRRKHKKIKWSRGCRNQSCKRPFRPRPPPPPPPAASTSGLKKSVAAHGGTRKKLKNRSKKYKNKHRK